jgi:hypothetical protein
MANPINSKPGQDFNFVSVAEKHGWSEFSGYWKKGLISIRI